MGALFPILLVAHVSLAVALLLPTIALPFLLRRSADGSEAMTRPIRLMASLQSNAGVAVGVALSGVGLVLLLGVELLARPWLIAGLALYAVTLLVAALIARPGLRRLLRGDRGDPETDPELWRQRARRQRWLSYGMAALIGAIGFLMATKPQLW